MPSDLHAKFELTSDQAQALINNGQRTADEVQEAALQAKLKQLPAARITLEAIEDNIDTEVYFTAQHGVAGALNALRLHSRHPYGLQAGSLSLLTFCVIVLRNGFTVTGESACASPENFDEDIGRQLARKHAVSKIWPLMGYELRSTLAIAANAVTGTVNGEPAFNTEGPDDWGG